VSGTFQRLTSLQPPRRPARPPPTFGASCLSNPLTGVRMTLPGRLASGPTPASESSHGLCGSPRAARCPSVPGPPRDCQSTGQRQAAVRLSGGEPRRRPKSFGAARARE
jgi:hypothetical protein